MADDPRIKLSRAARLAGVTRSEIQKQIEDGRLQTFEGQVRLRDLQALYPDLRVDDDSMLEKVTRIREEARVRRPGEPQDPETLREELDKARRERLYFKERADRLEEVLQGLLRMMEQAAAGNADIARAHLRSMVNWARHKLRSRE